MDAKKLIAIEAHGPVCVLRLDRPDKRNAINDALLAELEAFFAGPPADCRAVVLAGNGAHFSAGLDLSEHKARDAEGVMKHSQAWHRVFARIQFGLPVVAALHGGVIGGGLELAACAHVRVAEPTTFFQLPEGQRGIFVGGGATVRVARIIGAHRMVEMMLTGRSYDAQDGLRLGLAHYLVGAGEALPRAIELAGKIAGNASLSNYAILNGIARIEDMSAQDGLFTESLLAALAQTGEEAQARLNQFLTRKK